MESQTTGFGVPRRAALLYVRCSDASKARDAAVNLLADVSSSTVVVSLRGKNDCYSWGNIEKANGIERREQVLANIAAAGGTSAMVQRLKAAREAKAANASISVE